MRDESARTGARVQAAARIMTSLLAADLRSPEGRDRLRGELLHTFKTLQEEVLLQTNAFWWDAIEARGFSIQHPDNPRSLPFSAPKQMLLDSYGFLWHLEDAWWIREQDTVLMRAQRVRPPAPHGLVLAADPIPTLTRQSAVTVQPVLDGAGS